MKRRLPKQLRSNGERAGLMFRCTCGGRMPVFDSRKSKGQTIRRRRACMKCKMRVTTYEHTQKVCQEGFVSKGKKVLLKHLAKDLSLLTRRVRRMSL